MRLSGYVARVGENRKTLTVPVRKPEGKSQLGKPWCRWKDNIKMGLNKYDRRAWTIFFWHMIVISGVLL
jgi:hypothetical protein